MNAGGPCKKGGKTRSHGERSGCPIARALDLLGDRWTLLVVRDLMFSGKRQFGQFLDSGERVPTNILADRLRRLVERGLISKTPYQQNPVRYRYELTERGVKLRPLLDEMLRWASEQLADPPSEAAQEAHRTADELG